MNTFFTFVLGMLAGWLVEWVIDFFYWRKRYAEREAVQFQNRSSKVGINAHTGLEPDAAIAPDNLKIIKGIGVVIEGKLNDAGIYTFKQLGDLTSGDLRRILGNVIERLADEESLIKQARDLAGGKK